jgi:23S rRNA pseudouridine1911/1915/1917 synthase
VVHGGEGVEGFSLADWLLKKYPKIKKVGDDPIRPGIVHRLDKDVSGLMVIAKNNQAFDFIKKQFQKRGVEKEYTALVCGAVKQEGGVINFPIKRAATGHRMAAMPETFRKNSILDNEDMGEGAKAAITEFKIIKKFRNFTLVKVKIKTGRTHQIRVHFFAYGHPLVGDNLYSTKKTRLINQKLNTDRVYLVADRLSFKNLAGERVVARLELPDEFEEMLALVK